MFNTKADRQNISRHHNPQERKRKNLLVIELKTNSPEEICDFRKLELLTDPGHGYAYTLGLYIKFNGTNEPTMKWYTNGIIYEAAE